LLGIVVGLTAEARVAAGLGGTVAVGGGTTAGAEAAARGLVAAGVTALLSFGLAGGLDPSLAAGAIVVPAHVIHSSGVRYAACPRLNAVLRGGAGTLLATEAVIATAAGKRLLWESTMAVAADMESGAVAAVATAAGLQFAVLRAVCDGAEDDLPPAALTALDAAGRIRPIMLVRSLIAMPGQMGGLIRLGRHAALARSALLSRIKNIGSIDPAQFS